MSEAKHTPGKWEACDVGDYGDYDGRCRVILGDDLRIAVVLGDHDESKANARLISAAPDLLEALEWYRDQMCEGFCVDLKTEGYYAESMDFHCAGCKARAAIAKAKGEGK